MESSVLLRPVFGKIVTVVVLVAIAGYGISLVVTGDIGVLPPFLPVLALIGYATWLVFWAPAVRIEPSGVALINVTRTIEISWPEISRIDTKWALEIFTDAGKYTAWAAPAPGRHAVNRYTRNDLDHLPETAYGAERSVRPGDTPHSDSGAAALVVRREWERLRDAGFLDSGKVERERPHVRWHWIRLTILALLVAATAVVSSL